MLKGLISSIGDNNFGVFKNIAIIIKNIATKQFEADEDEKSIDFDYIEKVLNIELVHHLVESSIFDITFKSDELT